VTEVNNEEYHNINMSNKKSQALKPKGKRTIIPGCIMTGTVIGTNFCNISTCELTAVLFS